MPAYFLLGILRNLWRSKLNSLINIASLALGLAVFSFAFLYVKKEFSYDRSWPDAERVYRLIVDQQGVPGSADGSFTNINTRAYTALADNYDGHIERIAKSFSGAAKIADSESNNFLRLGVVDPVYLELFQFEVLSGSLEAVMEAPGLVAVEETFAQNYPGGLAVGSMLDLQSNFAGIGGEASVVSFEVGAIFRAPGTVSQNLDFQLLVAMNDYSLTMYPSVYRAWNDSHFIWIQFKPGIDIAEFESLMPAFIERVITVFNTTLKPGERISEHLQYRFQPVIDIHLNPVGNEIGAGDMARTLTIAVLGILVLLVGVSNSISLSLATVLERRREIGIRKSAGALPGNILVHFLGESVLLALLALVPALALVQLLMPPFLTLLNMRTALAIAGTDYLVLAAIAMVVGLLSGAYPALVLSGVKPQLVLKSQGAGKGQGALRARTLLVGFQFCFALTLMIATLALYAQLQAVRAQPLGFNPENLLLTSAATEQERNSMVPLLDELRKVPGVTQIASVAMPPNVSAQTTLGNASPFLNKNGDITEARLLQMLITAEQIEVLQIPVLAGRVFDEVRDSGATGSNIALGVPRENRRIVNRSGAEALGFSTPEAAVDQMVYQTFSDPTGKVIETPTRIIGVIEDSMYASIRSKPGPEAYMTFPVGSMVLLKFADEAADTIQEDIKPVWERVTGAPLQYTTFLEPMIDSAFIGEKNESRLLLYSAGLALFLSCVGLYGLAAFTIERNIKEVGVRKVLGATLSGIAGLYLWRYARPVLVASVIAAPVAVYFVLQWMQRFPYQMDKAWLLPLCIAAVGVVLVVALLTVSGVVLKAARSRPVLALRYE